MHALQRLHALNAVVRRSTGPMPALPSLLHAPTRPSAHQGHRTGCDACRWAEASTSSASAALSVAQVVRGGTEAAPLDDKTAESYYCLRYLRTKRARLRVRAGWAAAAQCRLVTPPPGPSAWVMTVADTTASATSSTMPSQHVSQQHACC